MNMDAYPIGAVTLAAERGWDYDAHQLALQARDDEGLRDRDAIDTTHPANWLTESEAEAYF